jgi:WD40-like Beta Propeller Repeat
MMILLTALAAHLTLATPQPVADVDPGKLKGDLVRLAWSDDGSQFYVQSVERDRSGNIKAVHHYLISPSESKSIDQEPLWASKYWMWKSAQASPAAASFKIDVSERTETKRSVSAPTGGALAKGGSPDPGAGTTLGDIAAAADITQTIRIFALKVKGETIGEWANEPVVPGVNYSWAPAPLQVLAFSKRDGGPLMVVDPAGQRQELSGAQAAILPAWSPDGKRLAWLERKDKKKYQLVVAEVSIQ